MQLSIHPKMKWEGLSNWPPVWAGSYAPGDIFPEGEEGVLTGDREGRLFRTSYRRSGVLMDRAMSQSDAWPRLTLDEIERIRW